MVGRCGQVLERSWNGLGTVLERAWNGRWSESHGAYALAEAEADAGHLVIVEVLQLDHPHAARLDFGDGPGAEGVEGLAENLSGAQRVAQRLLLVFAGEHLWAKGAPLVEGLARAGA